MTQVISRAQAKRVGLTQYFTGKPCKHGHIAPRRTHNGECTACTVAYVRGKGKEVKRQQALRWKRANKEHCTKYSRDFAKRKPWHKAANTGKERARKFNALPSWYEIYREEILAIYKHSHELTVATGIQHHVDHVVPLNSYAVTGLHVPWNLQVVPWYLNLSKRRQLWEE